MIEIVEITKSNWQECISLSVSDEQKGFIASNVYSLAESKFEPEMHPIGFKKDDSLIGFAMFGYETDENRAWIIRFMIDEKYQNKGLGKEALSQLIKLLSSKYVILSIRLCVEPENIMAIKFYEKFGFSSTGEKWGNELIFELKINKTGE